jgi:N-acylglucosamine 2-epimerase (GlcNAc 2-epimerase)
VHIAFEQASGGLVPSIRRTDRGARLTLPAPIRCAYLSGAVDEFGYAAVAPKGPRAWLATRQWQRDGLRLEVEDSYRVSERAIALTRRLRATAAEPAASNAIRLELAAELPPAAGGRVRFCAPAMVYSPAQHAAAGAYVFNDARLAYPLALAWNADDGTAVTLLRATLAGYDDAPDRVPGQSGYPQRTDIGAVGFVAGGAHPQLLACWPYREGDRSAMLDAAGTPAAVFHPVGGDGLDVTVAYDLVWRDAPRFADAVAGAFAYACEINPPRPAELPFGLDRAIDMRLASVAKTYTEWAPAGAGFRMNFDPERGYAAEAKAFGASFTEHGMGGSHGVLEYGFTGRQLNVAHMLAEYAGGEWIDRAERVGDFFVDVLATPSGFLHTLYSIDKARPLFSCGDPDGPVMHYLGAAAVPGTYTRMMTEAAADLLVGYQRRRRPSWLDTCRRFAGFLLRAQEPDGSWYRAYTPDGKPLEGAWLGASGTDGKASTAVPVPYLLNLSAQLGEADGAPLLAAARAAGHYVLREQVDRDDYRGGTLDNPNVVDKEAALLAMAALLALFDATGDLRWLAGAERAAKLAVTWHLVWDVPPRPGTRLAGAGVRSTGWGAINSTWGAGVTDIYSLFFLDAFVRLSRLTGDPLYEKVADLAAQGCQQLLSHGGCAYGFADAGMQPEGIAFCDQGVDAGLIAKGDTWGGLGWPYTAGTYGLHRYLTAKTSTGTGKAHVHHP